MLKQDSDINTNQSACHDISDEDVVMSGIEVLQTTYGRLTEACIRDLSQCIKVARYGKSEVIIPMGAIADELFFLREGSARAYYLKDGREITDWFAFEHDFICAINSFYSQNPSPHYIVSIEPLVAGVIHAPDMQMLCKRYHDFEHLCRNITTDTMLRLQQRIVALQFESAQQKYENLLLKYPEITNRVAVSHIASYLGITNETLSRIRHNKASN